MTACQMRLLSFLIIYHFIDSITANTRNCTNSNQCSNIDIDCSPDEDCLILCHGPNSCEKSTINCPTNGKCEIECNNSASCKQTIFNAQQASLLNIEGCTHDQSCLDVSIYCPQHSTDINCFIEGNDNLGSSPQSDGIKIYAINGWNDIEINYNGSFSTANHFGKMHCNSNYDMNCPIASNDWTCMNPSHYCNNPTTTTTTATNPTTTTPNINENDNNVITLTLDMDKLLFPIILSVVLLLCLVSACCVWYKILCKSKSKSKQNPETNSDINNENIMNDIIGDNNVPNGLENNNNITGFIGRERGSIVPSKSSAAISVVSSVQPPIVHQNINKPYRLSISSLAPPINQNRKKSISHSGSQQSHLSHYNNNEIRDRLSTYNNNNIHNIHNRLKLESSFRNHMNMNMEGGLSENELEDESDSELYIQHPQNNNGNRTPIGGTPQGTPQGTPEPPPHGHMPELQLQEHKTIDIDDNMSDNITISNMHSHKSNYNNVNQKQNEDSDSDLYLEPNQSMAAKSNVTMGGISTLGGTPDDKQYIVSMDIATDLSVGSVFNKK